MELEIYPNGILPSLTIRHCRAHSGHIICTHHQRIQTQTLVKGATKS